LIGVPVMPSSPVYHVPPRLWHAAYMNRQYVVVAAGLDLCGFALPEKR
jgi:hypothetical protein